MRSRGAAAPLLVAALLAGAPLSYLTARTAQTARAGETSPGTIAGHLIGAPGVSAAGVTVDARSLRASPGLPPPLAGSVVTSPDGAFRITGLAPGQYLVGTRGGLSSGVRLSPAYHPGVGTPDEATIVSVAAGQDAGPLAFRYAPLPTATLEGTLVAPDRRLLLGGAVLLAPRSTSGLELPTAADVQLAPDGRFTIEHVPAGTYELRARAEISPQDPAFFGAFTVVVSGAAVAGLQVPLLPGAIVQGTVTAMSRRLPQVAKGLKVRAPSATGSSLGESLTGDVRNGEFELRGLMTGPHVVAVDGLPDGWAVTVVRLRGRDLQDGLLTVSHGEHVGGLEIGVSEDAPDVRGTVTDADGRPLADALVVAIPRPAPNGLVTARQVRMVRSGSDGRYQIDDLLPGERRFGAFAHVDELFAMRPAMLARVWAAGTPATLRRGDTITLALTAVSSAPGAAGAR